MMLVCVCLRDEEVCDLDENNTALICNHKKERSNCTRGKEINRLSISRFHFLPWCSERKIDEGEAKI